MVLLRKWNRNESHWPHTFQIYTVWKSRVEISHPLMEISLNLMGFTDFFYKEMLTSSISFSWRNTFSLNLLAKASLVQVKHYEFLQFFLCDQRIGFRDISLNSELKLITENISASTWFTHFDELCNYLHSFQKQPAASFYKKNCCFLDQEHVGNDINKFPETGLDFFIKYILRAI